MTLQFSSPSAEMLFTDAGKGDYPVTYTSQTFAQEIKIIFLKTELTHLQQLSIPKMKII
jgi:hypothetical protein